MRQNLILARSLGFVGREAMYAGDRERPMMASDLAEWEVLYGVDPWGPERVDMAMGVLCSLTDACHRSKGEVQGPLQYMRYLKLLMGDSEPEQQSIEDMKAQFEAWNNG